MVRLLQWPFASAKVMVNGKTHAAAVGDRFSGTNIKTIFSHEQSSEHLVIRVGISCTGIEGAGKNLMAEIPHWNFDAVHQQAEAIWNQALTAIKAASSEFCSETAVSKWRPSPVR
jgi:putative alpha-1,2-mannosidase